MGKNNGHYKKVITIQPQSGWKRGSTDGFSTLPLEGEASIHYLDNVDQIVMEQYFSKIEAFTPVDRRNRYTLWNGKTGDKLFEAEEGDIGCCRRSCFQGQLLYIA